MTTNLTDNMNKLLDIEDAELIDLENDSQYPDTIKVESQDTETDINADYEYARSNLYSVIEKGTSALDSLLDLARASEHPRAFEVVGQLTKTLVDANKDLLEIQKKVKSLKADQPTTQNVTNNNSLYVGSTTELLKMIKGEPDV